MCETRLKSEIKCFEFSLGNGEFNFGIPLSYLLSYPTVGYGILTSRDWKGTARNEEHWVFSLSFPSSPPLLLFFLSFSRFFSRDVSTNLAYFEKRRVRVSVRSSAPADDETRLHTGNPPSSSRVEWTPSFPRYTVIRWFSRIPGEVFLRFEETVSGFPQHLRRTREGYEGKTWLYAYAPAEFSFSRDYVYLYGCLRLYFIFPKDCVCFVGTRDVFVNIRLWNLVLKRKRWRLVPWDSYSASYSDLKNYPPKETMG